MNTLSISKFLMIAPFKKLNKPIDTFSDSITNIIKVFTHQQDGYSQFQILAVILQRKDQLFEPSIWDFENTLEGGHPTLK
jgi:hypothetical protein